MPIQAVIAPHYCAGRKLAGWIAASLALACASSASPAGQTLFIAHKWDDSAGFYEADTGRLLEKIPVGKKPHEMALSSDRKLAFITLYGVDRWTETNSGGNSIAIIDLPARKKVGEIELGEYHRPHGIELGRSGKLHVTTDYPPTLLVVDPTSRKILQRHEIGQLLPHMVAVMEGEQKAYTANSGSESVTMLRLDEKGGRKHIRVGGVPMGLALAADNRRLFVANRTGDAVVVVDTAKDEVTARINIPGHPARVRLTPDNRHLLVTLIDAGDFAVVDTSTLKVIHRAHAGANAEGLGMDRDGRFAYVSAQGDNQVIKFSLADWKQLLTIQTATRPDPIAVLEATGGPNENKQ
jgi:YVTN family beta-propeller protein